MVLSQILVVQNMYPDSENGRFGTQQKRQGININIYVYTYTHTYTHPYKVIKKNEHWEMSKKSISLTIGPRVKEKNSV